MMVLDLSSKFSHLLNEKSEDELYYYLVNTISYCLIEDMDIEQQPIIKHIQEVIVSHLENNQEVLSVGSQYRSTADAYVFFYGRIKITPNICFVSNVEAVASVEREFLVSIARNIIVEIKTVFDFEEFKLEKKEAA